MYKTNHLIKSIYLFFLYLLFSCNNNAPKENKLAASLPTVDFLENEQLIEIKEQIPIVRESFSFKENGRLVNLNSKNNLIFYKVMGKNIIEDTLIKASELIDTKSLKFFNKKASVEISNYHYNKNENNFYLIFKIPLEVDSTYEGMSATFYLFDYWLNKYDGDDFSLISKQNITDVINDIGITNDNFTTHAYPEASFYADSQKIMYSVYKDSNIYNTPYITYYYKSDEVRLPEPETFSLIQEDTSFLKKETYLMTKFISDSNIIFYPRHGKSFVLHDSVSVKKYLPLHNTEKAEVFLLENKLYYGSHLLYEYPEGIRPIFADVDDKKQMVYAIAKDELSYYYSAFPSKL